MLTLQSFITTQFDQLTAKLLIFWTFPQFSTKSVDKIVDSLGVDSLMPLNNGHPD